MLKTRVIPCLTIRDSKLVKSVQFAEHRNIGSYISAARVFNARDVDEMIVLDLDARISGIVPRLLEEIARECFMPLSAGGGIQTCDDIQIMLKIGADKVVINTSALENPLFIAQAAQMFGSQCIVVSIDVKKVGNTHVVFKNGGRVRTERTAREWAKEAERLGAGEIFLTSIDRDGMMDGYDTALIKSVSGAVSTQVIASGGAGEKGDFVKAIREGGASAVAAASIFQYTQVTPANIKECFADYGIEARA